MQAQKGIEIVDVGQDSITLTIPFGETTLKTVGKTGKVSEHLYSTKDKTGWNSCERLPLPSGKWLPVNIYIGKPDVPKAGVVARNVELGEKFEF